MKSKKNFLFYCPSLYPCKTGGVEIYYHHLIKNIKTKYPNDNWFVLTSCKSFISNDDKSFPLKNRMFFITRYGLGALSTILFYLVSKKIKWHKIHNIIIPYTSNFSYNAIAFLLLKLFLRVPYVIDIHGGGMKPWKPYWLQKLFFRKAKKIAGISWPMVNEYSKRSGRKIKYLLPPLLPFNKSEKHPETLKKEKGLKQFEKIVLFVGSLKPLKGLDTLIKAFLGLGREFIETEKVGLVIVGDGPLINSLQEFTAKIQVENYVHFAGKIPNEEIAEYYAVADIFVIPSRFEGTPIALLEAMFNGLICIGTNVSGIKELITHNHNGLLFFKDKEEDLTLHLKNALEKYYYYIKLAKNAKDFYLNNFDYNAHLSLFYKFIY